MFEGKAAVVREKAGALVIEDVKLGSPRRDEVVVRIVGTGVCHTAMVVRDQGYPVPLPLVLGHEGAGFFAQSSFGTYAMATERNAIKIRKDVPLELMGPLGCGVSTGAGAVLNALKPHAASTIAIFGAGPVGLSVAMAANAIGCSFGGHKQSGMGVENGKEGLAEFTNTKTMMFHK